MKTKILGLVAALALTAGLSSCHDDPTAGSTPSETGSVNLKSLGIEINNAEKVITTSRASVDLSDFTVQILKESGDVYTQWKYSAMPAVFELPAGKYTARVYSHEVQKAEWDHPYFVGTSDFQIINDQITDLSIVTCTLSNIKVTITFTDRLRDLMGDDVTVTVVANDEGRLVFTPDETRAGYFEAVEGSSTMVLEFVGTVNGYKENLRTVLDNAEAGQHRKIVYDLTGPTAPDPTDPTGTVNPGVNVDVNVTDEDINANAPVDEDILDSSDRPGGGDDSDGGDDPDPTPGGDDPQNTIEITSDNISFESNNDASTYGESKPAIVDIKAPKGITHFLVKIESTNNDFIASAGEMLPLSFDLAYPGDAASDFESIGFPTGDKVIGKTALQFDISQFVPLLAAFPGTHTFTLTVQDNDNMQSIKSLVFVAN